MLEILKENWLYLLIGQYPEGALGGLALTLVLAGCGLALAIPGGVLLALARVSPFGWLRGPATAFVYFVRGMPLIMVIFWAYFLVPLALGRAVPSFITMIYALVFFQSAYLAEIIRAGIGSVPKGQVEAARSLGLTYLQCMRRIILPQALRRMLPALTNRGIEIFKMTTLASAVAYVDLLQQGKLLASLNFNPIETYTVIAVVFFLCLFPLVQATYALERRLRRSDA